MKRFSKSLQSAISGLRTVYKEEPNFRIHILAVIVVVVLGIALEVTYGEWIALIVVMALVLISEIINSIFERVIDVVKPTTNVYIKDLKDIMASSVVVAASASIIVGLIIFLPKIIHILN